MSDYKDRLKSLRVIGKIDRDASTLLEAIIEDELCGPREWAKEMEKDRDQLRGMAMELRELLSAFIDAEVLPGHVVTHDQWERACLLCGRWCPPFIEVTA